MAWVCARSVAAVSSCSSIHNSPSMRLRLHGSPWSSAAVCSRHPKGWTLLQAAAPRITSGRNEEQSLWLSAHHFLTRTANNSPALYCSELLFLHIWIPKCWQAQQAYLGDACQHKPQTTKIFLSFKLKLSNKLSSETMWAYILDWCHLGFPFTTPFSSVPSLETEIPGENKRLLRCR